MEEMGRRIVAERVAMEQGLRVELGEQATCQWIARIEEDERKRMKSPTERRTRERRQEIRDHRRFLKQDGHFHWIARTVRRLQDGPERREAFRQFWGWLCTAEYEDPLELTRGDELALKTAALREYEALEDEERRETGREFQVIHPRAPLREDGSTGFPLREVWSAGVALLQESAFPRQRRTLTMFMPSKEDSS
jgi:hypothetical protein